MEKIIRIDDHSGLVFGGRRYARRLHLRCARQLYGSWHSLSLYHRRQCRSLQRTFLYVRSARACQVQQYRLAGKIQLHRIEVSVEEAEYHGFRLVVPGVSGTHTSLRLRGILSLSRTLCDGNYQLRDGRSELFLRRSGVKSASLILCVLRAVCRLSVPLPTWTTSRCWMEVLWTVSL